MTRLPTLISICTLVLFNTTLRPAFANEQVRAEVERVLLAHARKAWPDATVEAIVNIDPRLQLSSCSDLDVALRGQQQVGRVHVAARCGRPRAWSVYLPAEIKVSAKVLVAARPLVRGQKLTVADIEEAVMPLSPHTLTLVNRQSIVGLSPKRPIAEGAVLALPLFARLPVVSSDEIVRLFSGMGTVRIETKGKALDSGQVGDQLMVENLSSGRTVAAWVIGPGEVSTRPGVSQ